MAIQLSPLAKYREGRIEPGGDPIRPGTVELGKITGREVLLQGRREADGRREREPILAAYRQVPDPSRPDGGQSATDTRGTLHRMERTTRGTSRPDDPGTDGAVKCRRDDRQDHGGIER